MISETLLFILVACTMPDQVYDSRWCLHHYSNEGITFYAISLIKTMKLVFHTIQICHERYSKRACMHAYFLQGIYLVTLIWYYTVKLTVIIHLHAGSCGKANAG